MDEAQEMREQLGVVESDGQASKLRDVKSWPVTIVASFFLLQGLLQGYSALGYSRLIGEPMMSGAALGSAVLCGIASVLLVVAGVGLFARIKACLMLAVVLAGLNLLNAGNLAAEAFFRPTPSAVAVALGFVAAGFLQYMILRSKATTALFE